MEEKTLPSYLQHAESAKRLFKLRAQALHINASVVSINKYLNKNEKHKLKNGKW